MADSLLKKNRVGYFDIAKGIGIILVVIAHIEYVSAPVRFYIVTFHMPLFFIVSGMLAELTDEKERSLKELVLKKLKRIMLPYLIFSILYPLIDFVYFFLTGNGDPYGSLKPNLLDSLMLYGNSVLWFLPTAFFGEVIFLLVIKACLKISKKYARILTTLATFLSGIAAFFLFGKMQNHFIVALVRFFISAFFVAAGSLVYGIIRNKQIKSFVKAVAGIALLFILLLIHGRNGIVDMHFGVYGNIYLYILNALTGSLGVIFISMSMEGIKKLFPCRILSFYGVNSLFVMITHINFYVLYCAEVLSFKLAEYIPHAKELAFDLMTVFFVLIGEFIMIKIYDIVKGRIIPERKR